MDIGKKIKDLRNTLNLSQEELANRCDVTKGYISQLENNLTSPSLATLVDILLALGTTLKEFFNDDSDEKIVFNTKDYITKEEDGYSMTWLVNNAQKNEMEPVVVTIQPRHKTEEDIPHEGEEFGYILEGEVVVCYDNKKIRCKKGETFYFKTSKVHYLYNPKDKLAKVIWVSSPPNF
jgi:transcriptional regulator with XRE-family HTH domain